jgi:hypothetical protein
MRPHGVAPHRSASFRFSPVRRGGFRVAQAGDTGAVRFAVPVQDVAESKKMSVFVEHISKKIIRLQFKESVTMDNRNVYSGCISLFMLLCRHSVPTLPHVVPTLPHAVPTLPHAMPTLPHAVPTLPHAVPTLSQKKNIIYLLLKNSQHALS